MRRASKVPQAERLSRVATERRNQDESWSDPGEARDPGFGKRQSEAKTSGDAERGAEKHAAFESCGFQRRQIASRDAERKRGEGFRLFTEGDKDNEVFVPSVFSVNCREAKSQA